MYVLLHFAFPINQNTCTAPAAITVASTSGSALGAQDHAASDAVIKRACEAIHAAEYELARFVTVTGDSECGLTLKTVAEGAITIQHSRITGEDVVSSMRAITGVVAERTVHTSGFDLLICPVQWLNTPITVQHHSVRRTLPCNVGPGILS